MYSSEDFERFYIRYKAEAMPLGTSIQAYCDKNNVPFNLFDKWYRDTRHHIVEVQVNGRPEHHSGQEKTPEINPVREYNAGDAPNRIMVDIRVSNGIRIQQRNLSYEGLQRLISNLRELC